MFTESVFHQVHCLGDKWLFKFVHNYADHKQSPKTGTRSNDDTSSFQHGDQSSWTSSSVLEMHGEYHEVCPFGRQLLHSRSHILNYQLVLRKNCCVETEPGNDSIFNDEFSKSINMIYFVKIMYDEECRAQNFSENLIFLSILSSIKNGIPENEKFFVLRKSISFW